ncbi:hypothetical protein [Escherichia coli]|uniref:hypothetical protein n=1 Tax=Escherichia coli TaxID=562 RepID=UPI0039AFFC86|nr:hypothetical protein XJ61_GM000001 [Escherichia coli]
MKNAASDGKSIGSAVQLPSMSGGTINSNYTKEGAKLLSRDANGNIGISSNPILLLEPKQIRERFSAQSKSTAI